MFYWLLDSNQFSQNMRTEFYLKLRLLGTHLPYPYPVYTIYKITVTNQLYNCLHATSTLYRVV